MARETTRSFVRPTLAAIAAVLLAVGTHAQIISNSGCRCTSSCGSSYFAAANGREWCYTTTGCGTSSIVYGYWDYCRNYRAPPPPVLSPTSCSSGFTLFDALCQTLSVVTDVLRVAYDSFSYVKNGVTKVRPVSNTHIKGGATRFASIRALLFIHSISQPFKEE